MTEPDTASRNILLENNPMVKTDLTWKETRIQWDKKQYSGTASNQEQITNVN